MQAGEVKVFGRRAQALPPHSERPYRLGERTTPVRARKRRRSRLRRVRGKRTAEYSIPLTSRRDEVVLRKRLRILTRYAFKTGLSSDGLHEVPCVLDRMPQAGARFNLELVLPFTLF